MIKRLLLVYVLYFVSRVVFYAFNYQSIGPISMAELPSLFVGGLVFDTASIVYTNGLLIVLSMLPFGFRDRRGYQKFLSGIYVGINALALMVSYSDVVYFRYVQKRFTAIEIFFSQNDNTSHLILQFIFENWAVFLLWLLSIAVLVFRVRADKIEKDNRRLSWGDHAVGALMFLLAMYLCFGGTRGGFSRAVRPITLSNASLYASNIVKSNLVLSNPFCVIRTLGYKSHDVIEYFEEGELASIFVPVVEPSFGYYHALCEGKNVVIFVLESFSREHSGLLNPDLYPSGEGYTPFLDSLMREGYYFTSGFANGRKSIDALPSILSSIPSFETPFVLMPNSMGEKESMPTLLGERGYRTMFFNGSEYGSMGFGAYASQAGIQEYFSRENFEKERGNGFFDGYWGIWDEPFIDYMGEVLSRSSEPFFASVFTLSSHHPFKVPREYEYLPEGTTRIHQGVQYTDIAIRKFFEKYSGEEWFKNTIFVFTADHVSSEVFADKTRTPTGSSSIIYFYYTPDGSLRGVDDKLAQQIDIMPTVLDLVGVDRPYYGYGRNVLDQADSSTRMAINWMGSYQAIGDSVVMFFDGSAVQAVYERSDTLQVRNIKDSYIDSLGFENKLKARLQQYYTHVSQRKYKLD